MMAALWDARVMFSEAYTESQSEPRLWRCGDLGSNPADVICSAFRDIESEHDTPPAPSNVLSR